VQEALTNAARHANARSILVRIVRNNGDLALNIEDDGDGFDVDALSRYAGVNPTLGLRGMQQRTEAVGGQLEIESKTGKGTKVSARFPIERPEID
jgi:signal transduction histidine kinase